MLKKFMDLFAVPDWRRASDYPDPSSASINRWAWEFLRRNAEFEAEYGEAWRETMRLKREGCLPAAWDDWPIGPVYHKWGLELVHPEWVESGLYDAPFKIAVPSLITAPATINLEKARHPNVAVWAFDLSRPIGPQISRARRVLKANQDIWHRNGRERPVARSNHQLRMFPFYLRAFDGRQATPRPTYDEIADSLGAEDADCVRKWVAAARRYMTSEYRLLVYSDPRRPES
jgi:hypothetical protein